MNMRDYLTLHLDTHLSKGTVLAELFYITYVYILFGFVVSKLVCYNVIFRIFSRADRIGFQIG